MVFLSHRNYSKNAKTLCERGFVSHRVTSIKKQKSFAFFKFILENTKSDPFAHWKFRVQARLPLGKRKWHPLCNNVLRLTTC